MSNTHKQITGVFTLNIGDKQYHNLVVNTGLASVYGDNTISSLCETLKVFNDDTEVAAGDTDYPAPVASSANITKTDFGVTGSGTSDYFYMRRTWTFTQGQILGVINKLAVYSDDGTLYAAALLKNADGEIEPVRPLFAPKVEVTYESRWHFKEGDAFTTGTQVVLGDAGVITVKQNRADKNNPLSYQNMNKPFAITAVEMFSDVITTDSSKPTQSRGVIDPADYTVEHVNGQFGVYGQILRIVLPETKYISDTPIATIVVTTTRGFWQFGFDAPLEKPTLSKRTLKVNLPFVHGTIKPDGNVDPVGSPDALNSIFEVIDNSTYDVSLGELTYTGGELMTGIDGLRAELKDTDDQLTFRLPASGTVTMAWGNSTLADDHLGDTLKGIVITLSAGGVVEAHVDGVLKEIAEAPTYAAGDVLVVENMHGTLKLDTIQGGKSFSVGGSVEIDVVPENFVFYYYNITPNAKISVS